MDSRRDVIAQGHQAAQYVLDQADFAYPETRDFVHGAINDLCAALAAADAQSISRHSLETGNPITWAERGCYHGGRIVGIMVERDDDKAQKVIEAGDVLWPAAAKAGEGEG